MDTIRIKQVDAFTRTAFSGNPAGVVLDADSLDARMMQKIASEMNLSETAFILTPESQEADLRIRWFTPTQEVELCGHATIAAFHVLAEEGRFDLEVGEPQSFVLETRSGNLFVDVEWRHQHPFIKFSLPLPTFYPYPGEIKLLCAGLGLAEVELSQKVNPLITNSGYCFVPLTHFDSLKTLEPNRAILSQLDELYNLKGFAVVTTDTGAKDIDWHIRFFAPGLGVFEDPVTGSANGPMAAFLYENNLIDKSKHYFEFRAEQGRFVNRTGNVDIIMKTGENAIEEILICGEAVSVMDIQLFQDISKTKKF